MGVISFLFMSFMIGALVTASKGNGSKDMYPKTINVPFANHAYLVSKIIGYSYLVIFLLMVGMNIFLMMMLRAKERLMGDFA